VPDNSDETPPSVALRVGNVVSFVLCLAANATVGKDIGKVSRNYTTNISPDGWAFSIWGLIYIMITCFVIYQTILKTERSAAIVNSIGYLFIASNFCNGMWCVFFTRGTEFWISCSCFMLLGLVAVNMTILYLARSWKPDNHHGIYEIILVDVLFSIYASWGAVASIVNIAVALVANKWSGWGVSPSSWAAVMICIAAGISIAVLFRCRNPIYPMVFVWSTMAIYTKNKSDELVGPVSLSAVMIVAFVTYYNLTLGKKRDSQPNLLFFN